MGVIYFLPIRLPMIFSLRLLVFRVAGLTPFGIVGIATFREILLGLTREYEFLVAFRANQDSRFMTAHHQFPLSCRNTVSRSVIKLLRQRLLYQEHNGGGRLSQQKKVEFQERVNTDCTAGAIHF